MGQANLGHWVIGMEGVALLRHWLTGAGENVEDRLREIARFINAPGAAPLSILFDVPEKDCRDGYAAWSATYDYVPNPLIQIEEPLLRSLIDQLPIGKALDAGCGTGRHAAYLASRGYEVIGVDASPEMLAHARTKLPEANFRVGDVASLPLADSNIDLAVCALTLAHFADLEPPIRELARVVRSGGRILLSDQHPFMAALGSAAFYVSGDGSFGYVKGYFHLHADYFAAFKKAGLVVRQCLEPSYGPAEIDILADSVKEIAGAAFQAALTGIPSVLIWELSKESPT
jgi:ubiquinone/menaquinone biosynthesis C-methylase UbiE